MDRKISNRLVIFELTVECVTVKKTKRKSVPTLWNDAHSPHWPRTPWHLILGSTLQHLQTLSQSLWSTPRVNIFDTR